MLLGCRSSFVVAPPAAASLAAPAAAAAARHLLAAAPVQLPAAQRPPRHCGCLLLLRADQVCRHSKSSLPGNSHLTAAEVSRHQKICCCCSSRTSSAAALPPPRGTAVAAVAPAVLLSPLHSNFTYFTMMLLLLQRLSPTRKKASPLPLSSFYLYIYISLLRVLLRRLKLLEDTTAAAVSAAAAASRLLQTP